MVIGSKKESTDQPKPVKRTGVTTDEAAAIVLASTRGSSPAFQTASVAYSDTGHAFSLNQPHKPTAKPTASNGEAGDVAVATAIAKTAALAAASEADSSDASLTKERKLKAERLRRAKMFAAMIKGGSNPTTQLVHSGGAPSGCVVRTTAGSNHEEREGSCVPFDADVSVKERKYRKKYNSRSEEDEEESNEDHKHSRKKHRSDDHRHRKGKESRHGHSRCHHKHLRDAEDEYKHKRSHHHRHHHWRHKHHSDPENEDRHRKSSRHRQHSDSENEDSHGRSSRHQHPHRKHDLSEDEGHQHRHRKQDLSEDEDRYRSRKHRRKHRSPSEKEEEIEEGEFLEKSLDQSEVKSGDHVAETVAATASDAKPSDVTEVPSDLRAKIRAMLLETI